MAAQYNHRVRVSLIAGYIYPATSKGKPRNGLRVTVTADHLQRSKMLENGLY